MIELSEKSTEMACNFYMEVLFRPKNFLAIVVMHISLAMRAKKHFPMTNLEEHNICAVAVIPLDSLSSIDMRLFTDREDKIQDYTVQYRNKDKDVMIQIRSDIGPHEVAHFDIKIFGRGKKILDCKIYQDQNFENYEQAINGTFMQIEKYDPFIGIKYWLCPAGALTDMIPLIYKKWKRSDILVCV